MNAEAELGFIPGTGNLYGDQRDPRSRRRTKGTNMRITASLWFAGLFLCTHSNAGQAQFIRGRREVASPQSEISPAAVITVTLKIDWNVSTVGKPVPASYTTRVSNGTALVDILNKAAGENKKGPFNKYSTTYFAGLGHMIIAMNGTWQDTETDTYWLIYDETTGKPTPVGMDLYKPENTSTTVFRLTAVSGFSNHSSSGYDANSPQQMPPSAITVSIGLDWNVSSVGKPTPPSFTTKVPNGSFLVEILNKAAGANTGGPFNRYSTTYFGGLGHMIIAMNGTWQDPQTNTYWMIYDDESRKLTPLGMDQYQPKNGSSTTFRLVSGIGPKPTASTKSPTTLSSGNPRSAQLGFIALCFLAMVKSLIFL